MTMNSAQPARATGREQSPVSLEPSFSIQVPSPTSCLGKGCEYLAVNWALRVVAFSDGVNVMLAALPGAPGVSCSSQPSHVGLALPSNARIHSLSWSPLPGAAVLAVGAGPHVVVVRVQVAADRLLGLRPLHLVESYQEEVYAQLCWHPSQPNVLAALGSRGVSVISWNDATAAETDSYVHAWSSEGVVSRLCQLAWCPWEHTTLAVLGDCRLHLLTLRASLDHLNASAAPPLAHAKAALVPPCGKVRRNSKNSPWVLQPLEMPRMSPLASLRSIALVDQRMFASANGLVTMVITVDTPLCLTSAAPVLTEAAPASLAEAAARDEPIDLRGRWDDTAGETPSSVPSMMLLRGNDGPVHGEGIAAQVGVLSWEAGGMQVVKECYHALPGLAIPDVLRVVDNVVVVGSTAAAHAAIRTFKLGLPLVPLRMLLLSSQPGVRLRGLSIQGLTVCGMLMRGPPPGSTTTPPAIFTAVASSTPAVLELSAFELEASAGAPISSSASGGERNTGMDNAAVNRQASVDAPSPSSLSSYGVARSDSRPNAEEPSQSEDQPTMVAELLSASQLSDLPQQHLSDESRSESLPRRHSLPEEELARMRALGEQELARMRALGITFGTELSRQTEQEAASRGETLTDMAQGDGLLAALLLLQNTVETRLDRVDQMLLNYDKRISHLEAACFRFSQLHSG